MLKKLTRHGNSLALVIDKGVLELLNIDDTTPLEISTDGTLLLISPVRDKKRRLQFQKALEKTNAKYGRSLKILAKEGAKLEPPVEKAISEEGLAEDMKQYHRRAVGKHDKQVDFIMTTEKNRRTTVEVI